MGLTRFLLLERRWGIRLDVLWLIVIMAGAIVLTSLVPLPPNDFWWHLKVGQIINETDHIPATNMFGWTMPLDQEFVYGAWLGECAFFVLYRLGGLNAVIFARTLLWTAAMALIGLDVQRRSGSWRLSAIAVLLLFLMSVNNLIVRPQNWSWVPFALYALLLRSYTRGRIGWRLLLLCPVIMVAWVNLHGAFVLGILLLGTYVVGEIAGRLLKHKDACTWQQIRCLGVTLILTMLSALANPQGIGSFSYVAKLMTDAPSQGLIVEWQSPSPEGVANIVFYGSVLLLLLVVWLSRRIPHPTDVLLVLGFLWMAWSGMRYVVWYGMVAVPIIAEEVAHLVPDRRWLVSPVRNYLNIAITVFLLIPVLIVQPWFVDRAIPLLPDKYRALILPDNPVHPLLSADTPVGAGGYLASHPGGRLYNDMGYGSYLIWAVPDQLVFADPRVELYPYEFWLDYMRICQGVRHSELLEAYGVDRILLDLGRQKELAKVLSDDSMWRVEYEDSHMQVWTHTSRLP